MEEEKKEEKKEENIRKDPNRIYTVLEENKNKMILENYKTIETL